MQKTCLVSLLLLLWTQLSLSQEKLKFVDVEKILEQVASSAEQNDFDAVLASIKKIPKNDSTYCTSLITKSYYLLQGERYDEMDQVYQEAVQRNCKDELSSIRTNISVGYLRSEAYEKSIALSDSILSKKPYNVSALKNKALALLKAERFEQSVEVYKKLIRTNPFDPQPHLQLGIICYNAGLSSQALMCFNMYLLLNDDLANSFEVLRNLNELTFNPKKEDVESYKVSKSDSKFKEIDQILDQRIAMQESYETGMDVDIAFVKQSHALFSYLKGNNDKQGLWFEVYVPVFQMLMKEELFSDYMLYVTQALSDGEYKSSYRRKEDDAVEAARFAIIKFMEGMSEYDFETGLNFQYSDGLLAWIGKSEDGEPIGLYQAYDREGRISEKGNFNKDHKKEGEWIIYHENGKVREVVNFENDLREGISTGYHPNGVKSFEITWVENTATGNYKSFTESGALKEDKNLVDSENDGFYKSYFDIGESHIEYEGTYSKNKLNGKLIEYHSNGKVYQETNYVNGEITGEQKTYNSLGILVGVYNYAEGLLNGSYKTYHNNGKESQVGKMSDGNFVGEFNSFHTNGNPHLIVNYNKKGEFDGVYQEFTKDGKLWYEHDYVNSKLTKYRFYDKEGKLIHEDKKRSGNLDYKGYTSEGILFVEGLYDIRDGKIGAWKYYSKKSGVLESEEIYKDYLIDGIYTSYYANGEVQEKAEYKSGKLDGYSVRFYPNGSIKSQGYFKEDNAQGQWEYYYVDGTLQEKNYFHKGNLINEQYAYGADGKKTKTLIYNSEGELKKEIYFKSDGSVKQIFEFPLAPGKIVLKMINDNEHVIEKIPYLNNVKHGDFERFGDGNQIITEGAFLNGKNAGEWKWYYNGGEIENNLSFDSGYRQGKSIGYHKNGQLEYQLTNDFDLTQGTYQSYWPNGKPNTEMVFVDDEIHGARKQFCPEGNLQLVRYYDHGRFIGYAYENDQGELVDMIPIINETGEVKAYYKNGQVSREYKIENGDLVGVYKQYYINGSQLSTTAYKYGVQHGKEQDYYPSSTLKSEIDYVLDQKHGMEIEYYENGAMKKRTSYLNGLKHGKQESFNEDGKLISTQHYLNDTLQF